jgi:threonine dehydrogenase-like Zn-dependent dehydrogenase
MRVVMLHGFADLRVGEVADPRPGPDDVVIEVSCVQPSVTECMLIAGDRVAMHSALVRSLAIAPVQFGGHEFAGVVHEVGTDVHRVRPGDAVTAVETVTCQECAACRRGRSDACVAPQFVGFTRPGAFAERVLVPQRCVVKVPAGVNASAAAAIQPLAGAVHGHGLAEVRPGETVLIIGAGVMGLLGLQVARRGGAGLVAISGRSTAKLALAKGFGADLVLGAEVDVERAIREATDGVGADVVVETAGGSASVGLAGTDTLELAARCARRGGRIVMVSVLPNHATAPLGLLRERGISLLHPKSGAGGYSPTSDVFEYCLTLVARGDVDVESLVTHRLTGIEQVPRAVEITRDKSSHGAINPAQVNLQGEYAWPS